MKRTWEIEPSLSNDFDVMVLDDDHEALDHIKDAAETLWDTAEAGEESVLKIRMKEVPDNYSIEEHYDMENADADNN